VLKKSMARKALAEADETLELTNLKRKKALGLL